MKHMCQMNHNESYEPYEPYVNHDETYEPWWMMNHMNHDEQMLQGTVAGLRKQLDDDDDDDDDDDNDDTDEQSPESGDCKEVGGKMSGFCELAFPFVSAVLEPDLHLMLDM